MGFSVDGFGYKICELGEGPVLPHLCPEMGPLASCYQGRKRSSYNQVIASIPDQKVNYCFRQDECFVICLASMYRTLSPKPPKPER